MGRHLHRINQELIKVVRGEQKRLIVSLPPRHTKTLLCGRAFPEYYLGSFPDHRVIYVTHNDNLANEVGWHIRNDFDTWGERLFGLRIAKEASAKKWWHIEGHGEAGFQAGGWRSLGGGIGANLLIFDDLIKGDQESSSQAQRDNLWSWYQSFSLARAQPGCAIVVIGTRWSSDDVTGRLLASQKGWTELRFPAEAELDDQLGREPGDWLFPEFKPVQEYEEVKHSVGEFNWGAQWQQRPGLNAISEFPEKYFEGEELWFNDWPEHCSPRVVTLDPSKGKTDRSDYSAFVRLGVNPIDGKCYVQGYLGRKPAPALIDEAMRHMLEFDPTALAVEEAAWQELLVPLLEDRMMTGGVNFPERFGSLSHGNINKQIRIRRLARPLSERLFRFHDDQQTRLLVQQLREFPGGVHDDGPDALEMAMRLMGEVSDDDWGQPQRTPMVPLEYR